MTRPENAIRPSPLFGLLLVGGYSRRMGLPKATLVYSERPQVAEAMELLAASTDRCFLSLRSDQRDQPDFKGYESIVDPRDNQGPISGIAGAFATYPDRAWLVLACDLPLLDAIALRHLIAARDPQCNATAFQNANDKKPEPLCTIYEPSIAPLLRNRIQAGLLSPRDALVAARVHQVAPPAPAVLHNVNTPEQFAAARKMMTPPGTSDPNPGIDRPG